LLTLSTYRGNFSEEMFQTAPPLGEGYLDRDLLPYNWDHSYPVCSNEVKCYFVAVESLFLCAQFFMLYSKLEQLSQRINSLVYVCRFLKFHTEIISVQFQFSNLNLA